MAALAIVTAFLCLLGWIFVLLRCYVRVKITKSFKVDDVMLVLATIVFTTLGVLTVCALREGMGREASDLSPKNRQLTIQNELMITILYMVDTMLIKLSISILLLRLAIVRPVYRCIITSTIIVFTLWTAVSILFELLACRPISFYWNQGQHGTCLAHDVQRNMGRAFGAVNIVSDWIFALLPIPMLWNIQMSRCLKFNICILLALGVIASIACIVRMQWLIVPDEEDSTTMMVKAAFWMVQELGLGINACAAATLRPLFGPGHVPQCYRRHAARKATSRAACGGVVTIGGSGGSGTPRSHDPYGWLEADVKDGDVKATGLRQDVVEIEVKPVLV